MGTIKNFWDKAIKPRFFGGTKPAQVARSPILTASRWDAARTTDDASDVWRYADSQSIDSALDAETRRKFRERARCEIANNSYAKGVALCVANAVVGSGPRLQIIFQDREKEERKRLATEIEWAFSEWAENIRLAEKLRAMRFARFQDGEAFALLCHNPKIEGPVQLDLAPFDAERVCGDYNADAQNDVDGITLDEFGNPVSYRVLTRHPGSVSSGSERFGKLRRSMICDEDATIYDAKNVIHWFRRETPEQHRGLTELHAALMLFALLRRFSFAVVGAAELAADMSMVIYTEDMVMGGNGEFLNNGFMPTPYDKIPVSPKSGVVLPDTYKAMQLKAEQPTSTYAEFKREVLGEIGRSLQIPVNIIAGNSSGYNYASGRLDHQEFQKAIRLDQSVASTAVMKPIFSAWWREYALTKRIDGMKIDTKTPLTSWYWDGFEHVDPTKEADAQATRLQNFTTNLSLEYGKMGRDWEDEVAQIAYEREVLKKHGLTLADLSQKPKNKEENDEEDEEK